MESQDALTIGEVAARAGVAVSAMRYYESLDLITSTRSSSGHRLFNRSVLRRIAVIQASQHVGLSLAQIRDAFAEFPADHAPTKRDWARLSRQWRPLLESRIHELEQIRDGLDRCIGCGCLSMRQCAIYNPHDEHATEGSGPRRAFPNPLASN